MNAFDEVRMVDFSISTVCPDCKVEVVVDSIRPRVRYITNGHPVPAGVFVNLYGICPKCQGAVALVWGDNANNLPPITAYDINECELLELLTVYARHFIQRVLAGCPDKKGAN